MTGGKLKREKLKVFYKILKAKDRIVGRKISEKIRFLLWQKELKEKDQNKEAIRETKEDLRQLRQQER